MSGDKMMRNSFTISGSVLQLPGQKIIFPYDIRSVEIANGLYIVLLSISTDDQMSRNLYAVNSSGEIDWQVEDQGRWVKDPLPFENLFVDNNSTIRASDFYGRVFQIDCRNGQIQNKISLK
jgi:hypothetical protein